VAHLLRLRVAADEQGREREAVPDTGPTASVEDQIASLRRAAGAPDADVVGIAQ
jgi:hypothetical protein